VFNSNFYLVDNTDLSYCILIKIRYLYCETICTVRVELNWMILKTRHGLKLNEQNLELGKGMVLNKWTENE